VATSLGIEAVLLAAKRTLLAARLAVVNPMRFGGCDSCNRQAGFWISARLLAGLRSPRARGWSSS